MTVGHAKFTDELGVCMATSGPGAIHLLNGLYDAKLDHAPVLAIVGQTNTTALGGSYQQEVDLQTLFSDVAGYVQTVMSPEQIPAVVDRAIRVPSGTGDLVVAQGRTSVLGDIVQARPPREA